MERVENKNNIRHNVMIEYFIEDFKVFSFWLGKCSIEWNIPYENYIEKLQVFSYVNK